MDHKNLNQRAHELMEPINRALMMCDDRNDLLILCFSMMNCSRDVLDRELGELRRKNVFSEHSK
jgi:hypothetical protein